MEVRRRGKLTWRGQEGYLRQVVLTRRENEREGQVKTRWEMTQVKAKAGNRG